MTEARKEPIVFVQGLVALTVGCMALGAYMGRDLTGGAGIALSVGAVICLVGLNSARPTGPITAA